WPHPLVRAGLSSFGSVPLSLRAARIGAGLVAEASVFELSNRALQGGHEPWRFFGAGGLGPGLLTSLITFGTLRGMGKAAEGQNILLQKGLQDLGMVLGHQGGHHLGILPRPEGGLAEQLLHAEVINLQMSAGLSLGHRIANGRLKALERSLAEVFPVKEFSKENFSAEPIFSYAVAN